MDLNRKILRLITLIGFGLWFAGQSAFADVDFVKDVKPIFEKHCISCHGPDGDESPRMDDAEDTLAYVEPGSPDESDLYLLLISDDEDEIMPPKEDGIPLSKDQIQVVKKWIEAGAEWPQDVELVDTSKADSNDQTVNAMPDGESGDGSDEKGAEQKIDPELQQIFHAIGSLHPAAVHLPIGLLLAAGFFALLSLRGNFVMSDCAYYCLWLGTLGAIAACVSGWWFSEMEPPREFITEFSDLLDDTKERFWHRTGGIVATVFAFLLALFAAGARNRDPDDGIMWKLGAILLAVAIGWVGHSGGELHYGENHYKDLNAVYERVINGMGQQPVEEKTEAVDETDVKVDADDAETTEPEEGAEVGVTSDASAE